MSDAVAIRPFAVGPLAATAVLLVADGDAVLVDPGGDAPRLLAAAAEAGATLREIWLTHAHYDHIGGLQDVLDAQPEPLPVRMHPAERPLYEGAGAWASMRGVPYRAPTAPTVDLHDDEVLRVGSIHATCLHTPGHAPGHIAFHLPQQATVLTGDALFAGGIGRTDLPYADGRLLVPSIRARLLTLPDATRCVPGHGGTTTVGAERRTNPFL